MKIARKNGPDFIVGKRIVIGQMVGAAAAWVFWLVETFFDIEIPAAMVTQGITLLVGLVQLYVVNKYGVTTND